MPWFWPYFCGQRYGTHVGVSRATQQIMKRLAVLVTLAGALGGACDKARSTAETAGTGSAAPAAHGALGNKSAASQAATAAQVQHPLLWSVENAGHTTYFFGTMHSGVDAATQLPEIVWSKL